MRKNYLVRYSITVTCIFSAICGDTKQSINPKIVVIVPSYNNEQWCVKNLDSIFCQKYNNFRVIYIDDHSSDKNKQRVEAYAHAHKIGNKLRFIENSERHGALYNLYHSIHSCLDEEIVVTVDGDDWLAHENVLSLIGKTYADPNVWLTYGQFYLTYGAVGHCRQYPDDVIKNRSFRRATWLASHLRTFRAFLFKAIKKEDLMYEGKFFEMTWDLAFMFPMLELAGPRFRFIPEVLYIYNRDNPLNDDKVNVAKQVFLDQFIRTKPTYPLFEDLIKPK